jgi:mRNA interferase MazF
MIDEGDVVLTPLPHADGRMKNRPALVLRRMPPFGDFLVCGISTQLEHAAEDFDEFIDAADADFAPSGLKAASLIRLGYLAVLPPGSFLGKIGSVSSERRSRLLRQLCRHLSPGAIPPA